MQSLVAAYRIQKKQSRSPARFETIDKRPDNPSTEPLAGMKSQSEEAKVVFSCYCEMRRSTKSL